MCSLPETTPPERKVVAVSGLTPPRPFRWLPYLGARHAIPRALAAPGACGKALCGAEVVVPYKTPPKYPEGLWNECPHCDRQWRRQTGLAQRPLPTWHNQT